MLSRVRNLFQIAGGRTKEVAGKAVGNPNLESDGVNQQQKAHLKRVGDKVRDAIEEL